MAQAKSKRSGEKNLDKLFTWKSVMFEMGNLLTIVIKAPSPTGVLNYWAYGDGMLSKFKVAILDLCVLIAKANGVRNKAYNLV